MNNKKKVITAIIVTAIVGLLTIVGSFALWTTQIGNNINVAFNTVNLNNYIDYTEGKAVFTGNLEATTDYPEGEEGTYTTFKINKKNNPAYPFYAALKLKINDIGEVLTQSRVLKWTVTSKASGTNNSEVVVAESDFVGTNTDDILILVPNIEVTNTQTDYNVYIWVDANNSNSGSVSGETINVELWMDVYQYRAPKVFESFCYSDGRDVSCNVVDSEKSFNGYGLNNIMEVPRLYTNVNSNEYWTSIDVENPEGYFYFVAKTSDNRLSYDSIIGYSDATLNGNDPVILDGLIPINFADDTGSTVKTITNDNQAWYDYENKKWANAVLVKATATENCATCHDRDYYQNNRNVTIDANDILAYYVWIPRYSYRVWQYSGTSATGQEQTIGIKFVNKNIKEVATGNGEWHTHPAFSFGTKELTGIWVGKFETSHTTLSSSTTDNNLGCSLSSCNTYNGLRILPNVRSLRSNNVSNFFYVSRAMETSGNDFGINPGSADSHMMKNSEWGAAAYLSHSKYGINTEIRINNQNAQKTGCGALNSNDSPTSTCNNAYKSVTIYPQSTTGNVTGIFDMSGGTLEYVMGTYNQDNNYGNSTNSGFNSSTNPLPDSKYYDNYTFNNFTLCTLATCGGNALSETKSWYIDSAGFVNSSSPWFVRGGVYNIASSTGVFYVNLYNGSSGSTKTFRLVLVADNDER